MPANLNARGAGHGLDAELAAKAAAKYDPELERKAKQWITDVLAGSSATTTTEPFSPSSTFGADLKNGQVLCHFINTIKPGTVKKVETSSMPFKQMENISNFIRACRAMGVAEFELFETVDLYEEKDLSVVVNCILALARTVRATIPTYQGPLPELATLRTRRGGSIDNGSPLTTATTRTQSPTFSTTTVTTTMTEALSPTPAPDAVPTTSSPVPPPPPQKPAPILPPSSDDIVPPLDSPKPFKPGTVTPTTTSPASAGAVDSPTTSVETASPTSASSPRSSGVIKARGGGYGLDAELAAAREARYDVGLEGEVRAWIEEVLGEAFPSGASFGESLKDGTILCRFINKIKPDAVKKVETSKMPFKQMENISNFLKACRAIGVPSHDLFETVDLFELKDLSLVVRCLDALGRTVQKTVPTFQGPHFGVKLATQNKRVFNEEMLSRTAPVMTKMGMGSSMMERVPLNLAASVTFGAANAGHAVSGAVTKLSMASAGLQERLPIDKSCSVTFGVENAGVACSDTGSRQTMGDGGLQERLPVDTSRSITFGHESSTPDAL